MSTQPETPGPETRSTPLDPFEAWRAARDASLGSLRSMRDASLESWSKMMIDFVNSDEYSWASAQWLDTYLTVSQPFQQAVGTAMTQALTGLNMPTRADVTNLASRLTNIEIRLDDLDIKLDEIHRAVQTLSASKEDIQSAIQAFSTLKEDIQSAVQTFSILKDAADASAMALVSSTDGVPQAAPIADAAPVKQSDETQGEMPAHPVNDAGMSTAKRSSRKPGKAKEAH